MSENTTWKDRLEFLRSDRINKSASYEDPNVKKEVLKYDDFAKELKRLALVNRDKLPNLYISTKINDKYLMALDCDSEMNMFRATEELERLGLNYSLFRSSGDKHNVITANDHFWVICDVLDTIDKIAEIMEFIPGNDINFFKCMQGQKIVNLRAFPRTVKNVKNFTTFTSPNINPMFLGTVISNEQSITKGVFLQFVKDFVDYWESYEVVFYNRQFSLGCLATPSILSLIQNPIKGVQPEEKGKISSAFDRMDLNVGEVVEEARKKTVIKPETPTIYEAEGMDKTEDVDLPF